MVGRERRDPAPVVDPRIEESEPLLRIREVRRRLDADVWPEDETGGRDRGEELLFSWFGRVPHHRARLRAEVLDDDLLHVAVPPMEVADREEALAALTRRLPDPNQDPGGERDREPACIFDRPQTDGRDLVGRSGVWPTLLGEPVGRGLEHQAHRRAHVLESRELLVRHDARVEVRQEPGLLQDANGRGADVLEGRSVATVGQPRARHRVPLFGTVPQGEQRLLASERPAGLRDGHDLFEAEVRMIELRRRLREGAVVTVIATEHRERDEDLPRIRDGAAPPQITEVAGRSHRTLQIRVPGLQQRLDLVEGERLALLRSCERSPAGLGGPRPVGHSGRAYYPRSSMRTTTRVP